MHEVEAKAALQDKEQVLAALAARGVIFGAATKQDDTVYVRNVGSLAAYLTNTEFLRLRVESSGRILFTFKHHQGKTRDISLHSSPVELELEVSSRDAMEEILLQMGYKEAVRIKKTRQKGRYEHWEICIDEVEGLGSFIELEELAASDDQTAAIRNRMAEFLAELGVGKEQELNDRYDVLLLRKQGS